MLVLLTDSLSWSMKTSVMAQLLVSAGPSLFPGLADRFPGWRRSAPPAHQPPSGSLARCGRSGSSPVWDARRKSVSAPRIEPARPDHSAQVVRVQVVWEHRSRSSHEPYGNCGTID